MSRAPGELSTVQRPRPAFPGEARSFVASVIAGPDCGQRVLIDPAKPGKVLVGTSPSCVIRLDDRLASRRHAALEYVGPDLILTDLQSTNGTIVQGLRILSMVVDAPVQVRVGESVLLIEPATAAQKIPLSQATCFGRVIGSSVAMRRLYPLCERLSMSDVPVLIEGETGTGKELLAEALHEAGARSAGPFIVFDCAAVAPSLVESQLFGHERGAFTGAAAARRGVFEQADGGTLFIDEIGDLDLSLQSRLLRAIERGEVARVGGEKWIRVQVRILAATRRDLDAEVQAGRFREDLFFRLAVTRIELPALRHRHGDIATLARHFWDTLGGANLPIPYETFERFEADPWPGNVRELRNAVLRRLALGDLDLVDEHGSDDEGEGPVVGFESILRLDLPLSEAKRRLMDAFEQRYVQRLLERHGGDVGKAAAASGIARRYFNLLRARHR